MWLRKILTISAIGTALLLQACGPADSDPGPGGVTAGDAKALDAAAQKLDDRDQAPTNESQK
jgi:hypothetical protein